MKPLRVRIGAPAYRMQVRAEHAQCLAQIASLADVEITGIEHIHCSILPIGRARALSNAMLDKDAEVLLSLDADCWLDTPALKKALINARALFATIGAVADPAAALLGVCVPQDDRKVNAWSSPGVRLEEPPVGVPVRCFAIGAAVTLHNLRWHRQKQAELGAFPPIKTVLVMGDGAELDREVAGGPIWPTISYAVMPQSAELTYIGEDHWHCQCVREYGGHVYALYTGGGVYHAAAGA